MSKNEDCGYISLLCSIADKPLDLWSKHVSYGGKVRRVKDDLLHGDRVIEITGPHDNMILTSITIPAKGLDVLNVKLPVLALVIKNLNLQFKLEVQVPEYFINFTKDIRIILDVLMMIFYFSCVEIIDQKQYRRRFSFMTYNVDKLPSISTSVACIRLRLEEFWNLLEINLQTFCYDVYGTDYEALQRITIYSNCHLRRVYLQDCHYDDETPVKMCQAFFDMYMLKRGINFIEKTCQTEECYTGPVEQSDRFAKDNFISTSQTVDLRKTAGSMEKVKNLNSSVDSDLYFSTLKRNHMLVGALNNAIKKHKQHVFTRKDDCFTKSSVNNPVMENKLEKGSSGITEKAEKCYAMKPHTIANSLLNIKINNHTLQPASSIELKRIAKSQFLKMHISEILFKDNKFPKRPQKVQSVGDAYVNFRNCTSSNDVNNVQTGEDNSTVTKSRVDTVCSALKLDLSQDKFNTIKNDTSDTLSDRHACSKYKYVKESKKSIANRSRSLISIEEDAEDITDDASTQKCIPPLIEKEAELDEMKLQGTYLTTDKIESDLIVMDHFATKELFEKLRDKGFAIPQVELSVRNMKNRRNFYAQEKFIEKHRWCRDKCVGSR